LESELASEGGRVLSTRGIRGLLEPLGSGGSSLPHRQQWRSTYSSHWLDGHRMDIDSAHSCLFPCMPHALTQHHIIFLDTPPTADHLRLVSSPTPLLPSSLFRPSVLCIDHIALLGIAVSYPTLPLFSSPVLSCRCRRVYLCTAYDVIISWHSNFTALLSFHVSIRVDDKKRLQRNRAILL